MKRRAIAETVRRWRELRGLSQRGLAERSGVGYVNIARLELCQTDPRLSTLRKLAGALKVTVGELVDGSPKRARGKR
jgi:transcriptional regulator with XRE-family HTH domain